jgi:hypothetical protein
MKLKFIKEFVSPSLGNVWLGRIMACEPDMAQKMVAMGYAEEVKEEVENVNSDTDGNKESSTDRPKRGRRPS